MECAIDRHTERQCRHVVLAMCVIGFLNAFIVKSMGVLLPVLLDQFAAHTRNVGVVVSLTFFCGNLAGKCLCTCKHIYQFRQCFGSGTRSRSDSCTKFGYKFIILFPGEFV